MSPLGPFAPRDGGAPDVASGQIPGLPGAPVRTPVRAAGARSTPGLWPAIAGRLITRQAWIELYGLPGYGLTLNPTNPDQRARFTETTGRVGFDYKAHLGFTDDTLLYAFYSKSAYLL